MSRMNLTLNETALVEALQRARGRWLTAAFLDSQIDVRWGTINERRSPNTPKVLVCSVRKKLGQVIETGPLGYRWKCPE